MGLSNRRRRRASLHTQGFLGGAEGRYVGISRDGQRMFQASNALQRPGVNHQSCANDPSGKGIVDSFVHNGFAVVKGTFDRPASGI